MKNFKQLVLSAALTIAALSNVNAADVNLLNVSYDPTRELYKEYNEAFAKYWKAKTGDNVTVNQSHGGGGKQTRAACFFDVHLRFHHFVFIYNYRKT